MNPNTTSDNVDREVQSDDEHENNNESNSSDNVALSLPASSIAVKNISHRTEITTDINDSEHLTIRSVSVIPCEDSTTTKGIQEQQKQRHPNQQFSNPTSSVNTSADKRQQHHRDNDNTLPIQLQSTTTTSSVIYPPISTIEGYRDKLLRTFDSLLFQYIGIIVLFGIVVDGAIFFFLLVGWHTLCDQPSRIDCEPRNTIYNISIQILNGFFTYMALVSLPWRLANFIHIQRPQRNWIISSCCRCYHYPQRCNDIGHNLYGQYDSELWFYIPLRRRYYITVLLLCNCLFQFINHVTRFVFLTYEAQAEPPGSIWTNVFFVTAFLCAGIAALWILYESSQLRKAYPTKFGHGPINSTKHYYHHHFRPWYHRQQTKYWNKEPQRNSNSVNDSKAIVEEAQKDREDINHEANGSASFDHPIEVVLPNHQSNNVNVNGRYGIGNHELIPEDAIVYDPTRAADHRTALSIDDRGALRMFGL